MKIIKTTIIIFIALYGAYFAKSQNSKAIITPTMPINYSEHWAITNWEKPFGIKFQFLKSKDELAYGAGSTFQHYNVKWFSDYFPTNSYLNDWNLYGVFGLDIKAGKFNFVPSISAGYSIITTNIDFYTGKGHGANGAIDLDLHYMLFDNFYIGANLGYHIIFTKHNFKIQEWLIPENIPLQVDNTIKALNLGINLVFCL